MPRFSTLEPAGPGRARRAIAAAATAVGLGFVFTLAAAGGVILHMGLPAPRRFATARINAILATSFKGTITVERVGVLSFTRIDGLDAEVLDPEGRRVLVLRGARARFATWTLVRSLFEGGRLVARIPELTIDGAEAVIEEDGAGDLGLARAFDARRPSTAGPGIDLSIPAISLRHAWVHGHLAAVPVLDADLEDVAGAFTATPDTTTIDVGHLFVRGRGLHGMNPVGTVVAHAALPADPAGDRRVSAHYKGRAGEIPVRADGSLVGKVVDVTVDVPETAPAAFAALAQGRIHLGAALSAHAEVHGELPVLRPELRARIGGGEIVASGTVTLPDTPRTELTASVTVLAKDLDVSLLQEGAPASRLTAKLQAEGVSRPGGEVSGTFRLENDVGEVSGQVVPATSVSGDFTESSVRGSARIAERGAPTTLHFSLQPPAGGGSSTELALAVDTTVPDLDAIPRAGPVGRGRAHLVAEGHVDLHAKTFSADASVELVGLDAKGVKLARGVVTASAEGSLESPRFVVELVGVEMRAGGYAFTRVSATARGTPRALDVSADLIGDEHAPTVAARARVTHPGDVVLLETRVSVARNDVKTTTRIASVRVAGGAVQIRGMTVEGLGDPVTAAARISAAGATVTTRAVDVDLSRLARLLGREGDARGNLSFDIDATTRRDGVHGRMDAQVRRLSVSGIEGAAVRVSASLDGRRLHGEVVANLGEGGKLHLSAVDVTLGGAATEPRAWETATGTVELDGTVDLARLLAELPAGARPVEQASGVVTLRGKASRASLAAGPLVTLEASTKGLAVAGKRESKKNPDGSLTLGPAPFRTVGIDGALAVRFSPSTGRTQVSAKLHDDQGPLASVDATTTVPIAELAGSPGRLLAFLGDAPIEAKIAAPRRSLDALPPALGKLPIKGDVELTADLTGTPRAPKLVLTVRGTSLLARGAAGCVQPVDLDAKVAYDGEKAAVHLAVSRDGHGIAGADGAVKVSAAQVLGGGALVWEASADVALTSFPLDVLAPLVERPISGEVSGKIAIADLHRAGGVDADLDVRGLTLDHATFPSGKVRVTVKDGTLSASARLDQVDGYAEAKATGAVAWGAALAPRLDPAKPVDVTIKSKNFRADAAMPFVQGVFSELDGRIDTDAQLRVELGGKDGHVKGAVTLRDGSFEVPQIGERFHGLAGHIVMNPWGTLRFEDFAADAPTGHLTATGQAVLQGLALRSASADVHIAKGQSIPITLEGVPMGRAYGDVKTTAKMSPDGKRLDIDADVPLLAVDLPQSTGHTVQPLEPDKTVRIGVHAGGGFVSIPLLPSQQPRPPSDLVIHAVVKLGKEVEVKRDTTVDVVVHGQLDVLVSDKAHVTGEIDLERGKLELQGKQFIIDHGSVSFVGSDPSNPMIVATAYWDAPDGTRVYADFSGFVTSGKLSLRSEPSLSQDQIVSLLLFGSPDGTLGAQPPPGQQESTGVEAAGMAGGVVTQGLNKAISGITSVDISTRVDTSEADNPRPELAVQITKSVSARLGYKLGVPAPGENPDRTELTLDWRFIRRWSLVAVVGDQGSTALDVMWRMRY